MNNRIVFVSLPALALLASSAFAQQPAQSVPREEIDAVVAPAAAPAARGGGGGRGAGGGGGQTTLPGGPDLSDAAYVGFDFAKRDPQPILTPAEELKHIILKPGYKLELVLGDPDIAEPTAISFDGNGRMYVL